MDTRQTLADFTFVSKYARYLPEEQRRETSPESFKRMMDMHRRRYSDVIQPHEFDQIERALNEDRILGSQRALQFGGEAIERKNMRINNCAASYCDRPRFFAEALWLLLCGCGVGFSVQKHHVAKLPRLHGPARNVQKHVVGDSIEGWSDALDTLVMSYFEHAATVEFDYSEVRAEGSELTSASARAPGPEPLRIALEAVRTVLDRALIQQGYLRPIDAYDIVMYASGAVLAGGVRRSATIALFSHDDLEMLQAKTGDWFTTNPQRARSNNSAVLVRAITTWEQFNALFDAVKQFGEPAFIFTDSTEILFNPCVEVAFWCYDDEGRSGWGFCNLATVNVGACPDWKKFIEACRLASTLATFQAGYQDVGYLTDATRNILLRDAQIGVSLTGMADNEALAFNSEALSQGAFTVAAVNEVVAARIGINTACRATCVKPEGTGSLKLKVASGIGPHHFRRGIRNVQMGANEAPARFMAEKIPEAVQPSVWREGDVVVSFPLDLGDEPLWLKSETTALSHLERVRLVQNAWVKSGRNRGNFHNNVSNTISVGVDEWPDVALALWAGREDFAGVSLLPASGDLDYPQAPYQACEGDGDRTAIRAHYERLCTAWVDVDFRGMRETSDGTALLDNVACAGGACLI